MKRDFSMKGCGKGRNIVKTGFQFYVFPVPARHRRDSTCKVFSATPVLCSKFNKSTHKRRNSTTTVTGGSYRTAAPASPRPPSSPAKTGEKTWE